MDEKEVAKAFHEKYPDGELREHAAKIFSFSKEQKEHSHHVTHHHLH